MRPSVRPCAPLCAAAAGAHFAPLTAPLEKQAGCKMSVFPLVPADPYRPRDHRVRGPTWRPGRAPCAAEPPAAASVPPAAPC